MGRIVFGRNQDRFLPPDEATGIRSSSEWRTLIALCNRLNLPTTSHSVYRASLWAISPGPHRFERLSCRSERGPHSILKWMWRFARLSSSPVSKALRGVGDAPGVYNRFCAGETLCGSTFARECRIGRSYQGNFAFLLGRKCQFT